MLRRAISVALATRAAASAFARGAGALAGDAVVIDFAEAQALTLAEIIAANHDRRIGVGAVVAGFARARAGLEFAGLGAGAFEGTLAVGAVRAVNKAEAAGFIGWAFAIGFARFEVGAWQAEGVGLAFLHVDGRLQFDAAVLGARGAVDGAAAVSAGARIFDAIGGLVASHIVDFIFVDAAFDAADALREQVAIANARFALVVQARRVSVDFNLQFGERAVFGHATSFTQFLLGLLRRFVDAFVGRDVALFGAALAATAFAPGHKAAAGLFRRAAGRVFIQGGVGTGGYAVRGGAVCARDSVASRQIRIGDTVACRVAVACGSRGARTATRAQREKA